jgi:glucokinase
MDFACIDIGGTNTLVGVGNDEFHVIEKVKSDQFLQDMTGSLERILSRDGYTVSDIGTLAFAVAGPVDRNNGVFYPPNIARDSISLRAPFSDVSADIHILNDCNSAALGEYVYGEDDAETMVYLTISTGIGAGIVMDGQLIEGRDGNFGEIGHMVIDDRGRQCGCGGQDHWEAYCSGANLPGMAKELFGHEFADARTIFDAYKNGDDRARDVVAQMQRYNGKGIANLVNIFDPDLIALGGGVALNHEDVVMEGLRPHIKAESLNGVPRIKPCSLGDKAVIHGLRAVCNGQYR